MDIKKIEQMGMEQGFSHVVLLDCDTIELKPEMCIRDRMCSYHHSHCWQGAYVPCESGHSHVPGRNC